jgi:hypothetical protein
MESADKNILRKSDKRTSMSIKTKAKLPYNKLANFKFPPKVDPAVQAAYANRKVNLISKKKFVQRQTHKPEDDMIGTLKIF